MDRLRPFVVAGSVTLTLMGAGQGASLAADMPSSISPRTWPVTEYVPRNIFMSGWYLRGDIGYRWNSLTSVVAASGFIDPIENSSGTGAMFGFGAGFRSNWIRSDLTLDFGTKQNYEGTAITTGDVKAKIQSDSALLNIYADLGCWYRLTPYIGAGIGAAHVTVSDFESTVSSPFSGAPSHGQWNLAWAVMAGTAFAISRNLQIDLGYRFLSLGNVQTADGTGGHMTFKNVASQEVRLGLRWSLDDLTGVQ